jgi:hypothetical protein
MYSSFSLFTSTVTFFCTFAQTNDNREPYGFGPGGEALPDVKGKPYSRLIRDGFTCSELHVLHSWIMKDGWLAQYSGGQPGKQGTRKKDMHLDICRDIAIRAGNYRQADNIGVFFFQYVPPFILNIFSHLHLIYPPHIGQKIREIFKLFRKAEELPLMTGAG